jgi:hypothetical protein
MFTDVRTGMKKLHRRDILSSGGHDYGCQRCVHAKNSPGTAGNCDSADICTGNP